MGNEANGLYFAGKTTHCHVLHTKLTHTKSVKKPAKIMKKGAYKPQKWCSPQGETVGFEKASFLKK